MYGQRPFKINSLKSITRDLKENDCPMNIITKYCTKRKSPKFFSETLEYVDGNLENG